MLHVSGDLAHWKYYLNIDFIELKRFNAVFNTVFNQAWEFTAIIIADLEERNYKIIIFIPYKFPVLF